MKILNKVFFSVFLLTGLYSQALGAVVDRGVLTSAIGVEYTEFRAQPMPNVSKPVQFILDLQENAARDPHAAHKIALVIGSWAGLGATLFRPATPTEHALLVRGINFAVGRGVVFDLPLRDFDGPIGRHQRAVAHVVASSQRVQASPLNNVSHNPMYGGHFPSAPFIHPYHATSYAQVCPVAHRFDTSSVRPLLPLDIQRQVAGIGHPTLDVFLVAQPPIPPSGGSPALLFRPHYWASPTGAAWAGDVWAGFSPAPFGATVTRSFAITQPVSVHTGTGGMVSSPNNFSIETILPGTRRSMAFWSLCCNLHDGRYALTLHWLLGPDGLTSLTDIMRGRPVTLADLSRCIDTHPELRGLYRPF